MPGWGGALYMSSTFFFHRTYYTSRRDSIRLCTSDSWSLSLFTLAPTISARCMDLRVLLLNSLLQIMMAGINANRFSVNRITTASRHNYWKWGAITIIVAGKAGQTDPPATARPCRPLSNTILRLPFQSLHPVSSI